MHLDLLSKLKCLGCGNPRLSYLVFMTDSDGQIQDGLLRCDCGQSYPIISGVPRMLPLSLSEIVLHDHEWFFEQYENVLKANGVLGTHTSSNHDNRTKIVAQTAQSFGYEWTQFDRMIDQYEENFRHYFEGYPREYYSGKLLLDAGCGLGRHAYYAARYGAEVVGIDLSPAIDVAYRNNRLNHKAHFIQADLNHLPLQPASFDMVYSLGVLHHLPEPKAGFDGLIKYVKPGGRILVYVYGQHEEANEIHRSLLALATAVRKTTTRMPRPLLKRLCLVLAGVFFLSLITPARVMKQSPKLRRTAESIPLHSYSRSPFYAIYKDTFDRLSAPLEQRYTRDQILDWFTSNRLADLQIFSGTGWRVSATVPQAISIASQAIPTSTDHEVID